MSRVELPGVTVERLADGRVKLTTGGWSDVFDETRRLAWADWYDKMHEKYGHQQRARYGRVAKALRELAPMADRDESGDPDDCDRLPSGAIWAG